MDGDSGADELTPPTGVIDVDRCRRKAQRRFGHHVRDHTPLGVVMPHVSKTLEEGTAELDEGRRWHFVEEAPHLERHLQIVNHGGTREQRGSTQCDAEASSNRVVDVLAFLHVQRRSELTRDAQSEPLVGARIAAPRSVWLEARDLRRPIRHPVVRYVVR